MKRPRCLRNQSGLSMVELLVAMAVQFILLAGMVHVYSSSRQMSSLNHELSRVQENGRYAIDTLLYDIRMAGYSGCRNLEDVSPNIIAQSPPNYAVLNDSLSVYENGVGWVNPGSINRLAGTDVITLQSVRGAGVQLTGNMTADNANIQIAANPDGLQANDLVLIFDCLSADLFRATSVSSSSGKVTIAHANSSNTSNRLSKAYQTDAQVMSFDAHTYFIGIDTNGDPGLYQHSASSDTTVLLARGVQGLELILAEDTDGNQRPDSYVNGSNVENWENVIGVRVGFLMQSADSTATESRGYSFAGQEANLSDDRRLRKAFWSYATLRNRI